MSRYIVSYVLLSLFFVSLYSSQSPLAIPGTLDTTFNPNGTNPGTVATTFNGMHASSSFNPNTGLVVQPDGKIVLAGGAYDGSYYYFGAGRFNADGSLDATFYPSGNPQGTLTLPRINGTNSQNYAIALQSDGKMVTVGYASDGVKNCFGLARLNTDGSLDTAGFNAGGTVSNQPGFVVTAIGNDAQAYSVAIQQDGKIVLAGYSNSGTTQSTVARYNSDGSLDTSFGTNGIAVIPVVNGRDTQVYSVAIDSFDGSIVVAGYGYGTSGSYQNFLIARFTAQGVLDTTFTASGNQSDVPGVVIYVIDSDQYYNYAYALVLQSDRKIVVSGYFYDDYGVAVARLNPSGTLDTTFNAAGSTPGTAQYFINDSVYNYSGAGAVGIQNDGSIVIAGYGYPPLTYETTFGVARITPKGQADGTFAPHVANPGSNMAFINNWTSESEASSLGIQKNGAIVLGGFAINNNDNQTYFAVARFNGGGSTITDPYALLLINNYSSIM